jgi:hypothetical protein
MLKDGRTPDERGAAFDRYLRVRSDFAKVLDGWPEERAKRNLLVRLGILVAAAVLAGSGLGVAMIRSGQMGLFIYAAVLVAASLAITYRGEVVTSAIPGYSNNRAAILLALIALFLLFVPGDSPIYGPAISLLGFIYFCWPALGVLKSLRDLASSRQVLALTDYFERIPKDERRNALMIIKDRSGMLLVHDSRL